MNAVKWALTIAAIPAVFALSCTVTAIVCIDCERKARADARRHRARKS